MAKRKKSSEEPRRLLKGKIVLPEVIETLKATGKPVNVICGIQTGYTAKQVISLLKKLKIEVNTDPSAHTDYYVFATIANLKHVEKINEYYNKPKQRSIQHVWLDKDIRSCVEKSQDTIKAGAARRVFNIEGEDINWAVLDSGIDINHQWFAANNNCSASRRKDFTNTGFSNVVYHGTHVAGIITSIAPKVKLYDFRVIKPDNTGSSSMVIKAMHHIRKINFDAGKTIIHGANLSIGGPVPIGSFGCGWSPECQEADRLAASGVIVCAAAGNDGHKYFATLDSQSNLEIYPSFIDVGISDPGNARNVITVGSTHRLNPHSYGPSFFSSKGPTGDGRIKPDCLAPGEKIVSARAGGGVVEMDGTSMATPHVSGALALFLSANPEFIGRAMEVKNILLKSCTDLGRDHYFQGAGLVDLLRMMQTI